MRGSPGSSPCLEAGPLPTLSEGGSWKPGPFLALICGDGIWISSKLEAAQVQRGEQFLGTVKSNRLHVSSLVYGRTAVLAHGVTPLRGTSLHAGRRSRCPHPLTLGDLVLVFPGRVSLLKLLLEALPRVWLGSARRCWLAAEAPGAAAPPRVGPLGGGGLRCAGNPEGREGPGLSLTCL